MIDFRKYYQKYLKHNKYEKIFGKYDPEFKKASKYLKNKGFLTKSDLFEIARWKSPRRAKDVFKNKEGKVEDITRIIFKKDHPEDKIKGLDDLKGVGIPTASAILCVCDPENYGVIDIRAWNTLSETDKSFIKKKYSNFAIKDYKKYLVKIRDLADKNKMTCRQVDMALWVWDKENKNMKKKPINKDLRKIFGKSKPALCPECKKEVFLFSISCRLQPCYFEYLCLKCSRAIGFQKGKMVKNEKLTRDKLIKKLERKEL
jgi:hypothetical protein